MVAGLSAYFYSWRSSGYLEIYYAAAVRSMSMSWHNFLYGAFDPAGTVTTDKLPGAFWVQALSARIFGLHDWAIVLPQVFEGALSVLVLYRVVRRCAGPLSGLAAAVILAVAPANVTLDRGNVSDTLMILLVVLAADATVSAVLGGRVVHLLLAGLWIGLAFQAKMIEAWLVVPALALSYLIAAPPRLRRRALAIALMALLTVGVSLSWMLFVTAQPKDGRPYVDGSRDDSVFEQVFDYNGFGRIGQPSPNAVLFETIHLGGLASSPPGWNRMLVGPFGDDSGWLIPASLASMILGLIGRRGRSRGDPLRASLVLWGAWLAALIAVFSISTTVNSYYTAALTPAIAALLATGMAVAWEHRQRASARMAAAAVVLGTAVYAAWLLPERGTGLQGWLGPVALSCGAAVATVLVASIWIRSPRPLFGALLALGVGSCLIVPVTASATVVGHGLGAFDTPFEPATVASATKQLFGPTARRQAQAVLPGLERLRSQFHTRDLMATQTAVLAAPSIFESGQEVYPLGGYNGTGVEPTLGRLKSLLEANDFRILLVNPTSRDPRYRFVVDHCVAVRGQIAIAGLGVYFCPLSTR